jgi:hypothetical protein
MGELRDLTKLVWPFPAGVVQSNPSGGGTYVAHPVVEQRLLDVLGPVDTELVEIVRGHIPAKPPDPKAKSQRGRDGTLAIVDGVVGVVLRMRVTVDGRQVTVEEVGDCEDPANWPHDGARLKDAFSDAYKRCAMRLGVGLHLWVKDQRNFYIAEKLKRLDDAIDVDPVPEQNTGGNEDAAAEDETAVDPAAAPCCDLAEGHDGPCAFEAPPRAEGARKITAAAATEQMNATQRRAMEQAERAKAKAGSTT